MKHLIFSKNDNENLYASEIVEFDAWQYNDLEHIWSSLMMEFMNKCMRHSFFYANQFLDIASLEN